MDWTWDKPTKPGLYVKVGDNVCRDANGNIGKRQAYIRQLSMLNGELVDFLHSPNIGSGPWFGPIPNPPEREAK